MSDFNPIVDRPPVPPNRNTLHAIRQAPLIDAAVLLPQLVKEMK